MTEKERLIRKTRMKKEEFEALSLDLKTPEGFWNAVVNYPYALKKEKDFFHNHTVNPEEWLDWKKMKKNIPNINRWYWLRGIGFLDKERHKDMPSYFDMPYNRINWGYDLGLFVLYAMSFRRNPEKASLKMNGKEEMAVRSATVKQWKRLFAKAVKSGWNINTVDSDGRMLTHLVSKVPDMEGFEWLFSMGASLNKKDYLGRSPLDELRKHYPDLATFWEFKPDRDELYKAIIKENDKKVSNRQALRF